MRLEGGVLLLMREVLYEVRSGVMYLMSVRGTV